MKYKITSKFLQQESFRSKPHKGLDFKMEIGEPLRAIESGIIHIRDYGNVNAGKTVLIETEEGKTFIYGHLSKFADIKEGQHVEIGDLIGWSGNSGFSTGAHLHFGVRIGNEYINPSPYISHIQNMNNIEKLQMLVQQPKEIIQKSYSFTDLFNAQTNVYSDLFNSLKLNLINLLSLVDHSMFIHYIHYLFKFFS